jgi:hypothetical protein
MTGVSLHKAMASDITFPWQFLIKNNCCFFRYGSNSAKAKTFLKSLPGKIGARFPAAN